MKTLQPYLKENNPLIFVPGRVGGRKGHFNEEEAEVLVQTCQRKDRANNGDLLSDVIAKMMLLKPSLSAKQCRDAWSRTVHKNAHMRGVLKKHLVTAQRTSTARSAITVEQQWRFFHLVDTIDKKHEFLNVDDGSGVVFRDLAPHFKINLGEECIMACDGSVTVVGCASKKK